MYYFWRPASDRHDRRSMTPNARETVAQNQTLPSLSEQKTTSGWGRGASSWLGRWALVRLCDVRMQEVMADNRFLDFVKEKHFDAGWVLYRTLNKQRAPASPYGPRGHSIRPPTDAKTAASSCIILQPVFIACYQNKE